jgi:hypothetical protein
MCDGMPIELALLPDRRRPEAADMEWLGLMTKPPGEYPPIRAAVLIPKMEFCLLATESCDWPYTDPVSDAVEAALARNMDDRRLSVRLSSLCSSRMASSMLLVMDSRSAVASSAAMLPRKFPA